MATPDTITLEVGGRTFVTLRETLSGSTFLSSMIVSGRWEPRSDGTYFLDADPDIFAHILNHLRRGGFPLLWDKENGHDLPMYARLLQEAEYLGVDDLANWLRMKKYLRAITIEEIWSATASNSAKCVTCLTSDTESKHYTHWARRFRWACKYSIREQPCTHSSCYESPNLGWKDTEIFEVYTYKRKIVFNEDMVMPGNQPKDEEA